MSSSNSSDDRGTIVMVLGSSFIQAGFAGSNSPRCVYPSVVGTPKKTVEPMMIGADINRKYCGDEAICNSAFVDLSYPIKRGAITNWEYFDNIMNYTFHHQLRVHPEDYSLLITEPPLNPRDNRERLCQVLFETYNVPQMRIELDALLSLYCSGRTTGLSMSSGGGVTSVLPVYEGYAIQSAMKRLDIGGSDVTEYMTKLLIEGGYYFRTSTDREIVRKMKESLAFVSCNFNQDMVWARMSSEMEKSYELPDGNIITISNQLFQCTECLFQPITQLGREHVGIHQLIHNSIKECDIDVRRDLYSNIILAGGNTRLPGFSERIQKEIINLAPVKSKVKIVCPPERRFSTWIGGCILSSIHSNWIGRDQYDEVGPSIMSTRFL